jgi:KDO2-lipid IV(A) lauroyltransferase
VPLRKRARRALRFGLVRGLVALVGLLPLAAAQRLGEALGGLAFRVARRERERALASLAVAFPSEGRARHEALARACFRHLGRMALELACVARVDARLEQLVLWEPASRAVLERALARGRGVVFVSGHVGSWELMARRVAREGFPSQSIARETSDPRLTRFVEQLRLSGRVRSIWRGEPGAARAMLRALRGNELLGLLIDQDTRVQSVAVPFFGRPAATPRAAADLALKTGAAVVVGFGPREADGTYRVLLEEVPPEHLAALAAGEGVTGGREGAAVALTAELTRRIEDVIRRYPSQWVWMHQRWKTPV